MQDSPTTASCTQQGLLERSGTCSSSLSLASVSAFALRLLWHVLLTTSLDEAPELEHGAGGSHRPSSSGIMASCAERAVKACAVSQNQVGSSGCGACEGLLLPAGALEEAGIACHRLAGPVVCRHKQLALRVCSFKLPQSPVSSDPFMVPAQLSSADVWRCGVWGKSQASGADRQ